MSDRPAEWDRGCRGSRRAGTIVLVGLVGARVAKVLQDSLLRDVCDLPSVAFIDADNRLLAESRRVRPHMML